METHGYTLFIDQASNAAGVALCFNRELIATTTLYSTRERDVITQRLRDQIPQLTAFLEKHLPHGTNITRPVFEGVRSRIVLITVGAFLTCPRIHARISPTGNFVESGSWKAWAKRQGATGPEIKGIRTLTQIRPELFTRFRIATDDEADAILMAFTWIERHGQA